MARLLLDAACGNTPQSFDLEGAVIRSLALLTQGDAADFQQYADPPHEVIDWLNKAEIKPVRGLLMSVLRRWHQLQQQERQQSKKDPPNRASRRVSPD